MHIIVLENEVSSRRGGQERSLLDVCRCMYSRGHKISLLYVQEGDLFQQYRKFCTDLVKVNSYRIERKRILSSLPSFLQDNIKVEVSRDSIVYSNQYHNSFFAHVLAVSKNIPFVCHLRLPPPPKLGLQWSIGMRNAKRLIAVSQQTKCDWVNQGFQESKIDVVYNGVNTEHFKPSEHVSLLKREWGIPENHKIISYIGRLDKDKGLDILIKGFALFLNFGINAKLLIAGKPLSQDGAYQQSLLKLSQDLGIEKYVDFLGHIADPISIYQSSDVSVLPCVWSEPCPRSIIESMACGTPVIASQIGGIPEILTGEFQNLLFEPKNAQKLAEALKFVLKWKDIDAQLSVKCQQHISCNFNLDIMMNGVENIFLKSVNQYANK